MILMTNRFRDGWATALEGPIPLPYTVGRLYGYLEDYK